MAGEIVTAEMFWVVVIGLTGGSVHSALQGAFVLPSRDKTNPDKINLGIIGDLIVGAAAAVVTYLSTIATATSTTTVQLVFLAFTSGIGGSAVLLSYVNGKEAAKSEQKLKDLKAWS